MDQRAGASCRHRQPSTTGDPTLTGHQQRAQPETFRVAPSPFLFASRPLPKPHRCLSGSLPPLQVALLVKGAALAETSEPNKGGPSPPSADRSRTPPGCLTPAAGAHSPQTHPQHPRTTTTPIRCDPIAGLEASTVDLEHSRALRRGARNTTLRPWHCPECQTTLNPCP